MFEVTYINFEDHYRIVKGIYGQSPFEAFQNMETKEWVVLKADDDTVISSKKYLFDMLSKITALQQILLIQNEDIESLSISETNKTIYFTNKNNKRETIEFLVVSKDENPLLISEYEERDLTLLIATYDYYFYTVHHNSHIWHQPDGSIELFECIRCGKTLLCSSPNWATILTENCNIQCHDWESVDMEGQIMKCKNCGREIYYGTQEWKDVSNSKCIINEPDSESQNTICVKYMPEDETKQNCPHEHTFSYNHGYHTICKDCGEEIE